MLFLGGKVSPRGAEIRVAGSSRSHAETAERRLNESGPAAGAFWAFQRWTTTRAPILTRS
jgi:hypothetical protein